MEHVGLDQPSKSMMSAVSTGMGDHVRVRLPGATLYFVI